MKKIGDCAFLECDKIKSVTFADDSELQTIGKKAFFDASLEKYFFANNNKIFMKSFQK